MAARAHVAWLYLFVFVLVLAVSSRAQAAAPSVTTTPASSFTTSSADLNGTGTPAGETTTGWFRYSTTNPGTCDDVFGTRVPTTGGTNLGAGAGGVPYSITVTGLTSGQTYFYCAIVENASGKAFGSVLAFTVPGVPQVTTTAVQNLMATTATLAGSTNPVAAATTGWFRYSTANPGTCNDTFGTRAPTTGGSNLGSGTSAVAYTRNIAGLSPATTYYYCAISENAHGLSVGSVLSFTTDPNPPSVTTSSASLVTGSTAQLNGSANPGGAATTGWFRYATTSPGSCNDSFGTRAPASGGDALGSGNGSVAFNEGVTGLTPGATYFFCAIAQNSAGTSFGSLSSFTTPLPPIATTVSATSITNTSATLNGQGNPQGAAATGWFRYATTDPGTCNDTFGSRAPTSGGSNLGSGSSNISYNQGLSGLSAATTYYYCAIVQSAEGTAFGVVQSFTTDGPPTAVTNPATSITTTSAVLNGTGNPNGSTATGWYRYSTTNPGSCNNTFGTLTSSTGLGSGNAPVSFPRTVSGLLPGQTYYFCAIANNTYGMDFGAVLSFSTPAAAPSVSTNSASLLTRTTVRASGPVARVV